MFIIFFRFIFKNSVAKIKPEIQDKLRKLFFGSKIFIGTYLSLKTILYEYILSMICGRKTLKIRKLRSL